MKVTVELENGSYFEVAEGYLLYEPPIGDGLFLEGIKDKSEIIKAMIGEGVPQHLIDVLIRD